MRKRGFTLIELMIVIAIIGLLAALIIPNFSKARSQSKFSACKTNIKNIATAIEMYSVAEDAMYPINLGKIITADYIPQEPFCPEKQTSYRYGRTSSPCVGYSIWCAGNNHYTMLMYTGPGYGSVSGLKDNLCDVVAE